jgi:hypothetical protein
MCRIGIGFDYLRLGEGWEKCSAGIPTCSFLVLWRGHIGMLERMATSLLLLKNTPAIHVTVMLRHPVG